VLKPGFSRSSRCNLGVLFSTLNVLTIPISPLPGRPASLQLPSPPSAIFPSPDGACLLTLHTQGKQPSLTAYHWETFGSTTGIALDVPKFPLQGAVLTSLVNRGRVFLLGLDVDAASVKSIAIDITKKLTEFTFKENGSRNASNNKVRQTLHNSLLDCHAEVWSRYPVIAAVRRRTVTSLSERKPKSLTFIAENDSQPFGVYFSGLIQTFERTTRKPTGDELRRIKVSAEQFGAFSDKVVQDPDWDVSRYRIGEWLVDVFCLIPIHIAVCRENRFVPLANGVLSSDLERALLGAEVSKIVDKLSFGWYESIFQSYMATKVLYNPRVGLSRVLTSSTARKGGVVHGPTICGQELLVESSSGYIICRKRHADNRYALSFCLARQGIDPGIQREYGCP
jgi:hypothetical protein